MGILDYIEEVFEEAPFTAYFVTLIGLGCLLFLLLRCCGCKLYVLPQTDLEEVCSAEDLEKILDDIDGDGPVWSLDSEDDDDE